MLRYSPMLETYWVEMVGNPDKRDKTARTLEKAAQTLETLFGDIVASEKSGKNEMLPKRTFFYIKRHLRASVSCPRH
jgi:hypothetical protein